MAFIETISAHDAAGAVRDMYGHQQRHYGFVPHYATVFSHRPHVMQLWSDLQYGIRRDMDKCRFELVTVAAATAVRSTYCSLAHGQALLQFYSSAEVRAIIEDTEASPLTPAEKQMLRFARKVAIDASAVTAREVSDLKSFGFSDTEIFDIAATAAARTFFAQLCEGLGASGDHRYEDMDAQLRSTLTVGRPLECSEPERLSEPDSTRSVLNGAGRKEHDLGVVWQCANSS